MFQQEEATDAKPEQGSRHTSKAATMACPAWGDRVAARWPASTASSKVRLGIPVQCGKRALCSSAGRAETPRLGEIVLGSWGLSALVLVADGGQRLSPPAAGVALRCDQRWETGEPPS